jgi:hypothetical protein
MTKLELVGFRAIIFRNEAGPWLRAQDILSSLPGLKAGKRTVHRLAASGEIPAFRTGSTDRRSHQQDENQKT